MPPIRFVPLYQPRPWGGRQMESVLGRPLPPGLIGESWDLVDRPEAQSLVAEGPYAGLTLHQLCHRHGRELLRPDWDPMAAFPLIVKWLDCQGPLSLQVHPTPPAAQAWGGQPKDEAWVFAKVAPDAKLYAGLRPGVTQAQVSQALAANTLPELLQEHQAGRYDALVLPAGCPHALMGGQLVLEVQTNSDTTYRLYDWGRPRALHIAQALQSIDWQAPVPRLQPAYQKRIDTPYWTMERLALAPGQKITLEARPTASLVSVMEGQLGPWGAGENLLIPYGSSFTVEASLSTHVILTHSFL